MDDLKDDKTYIGSPDNPKTTAVVSYITFIGWLIAYFGLYPKNRIAHSSFHLRQSLLIHIISFLIKVAFSFLPPSAPMLIVISVLSAGLFGLWLLGILDALNSRQRLIPIIGPLAQSLFPRI
jgi:uncharacterized membrane protein